MLGLVKVRRENKEIRKYAVVLQGYIYKKADEFGVLCSDISFSSRLFRIRLRTS